MLFRSADQVVGDDLGGRDVRPLGEKTDPQTETGRGLLHHAGQLASADDGELGCGHALHPSGAAPPPYRERKLRRSVTVMGEMLPNPRSGRGGSARWSKSSPRAFAVVSSTRTRLLRATCERRAARLTAGP